MQETCPEYQLGFCLKTEFLISSITMCCELPHNNYVEVTERTKSKIIDRYKEVIDELDIKIANISAILNYKSNIYERMELADKILEMNSNNPSSNLVRALSQVTRKLESMETMECKFEVCAVCANVLDTGKTCSHIFHEKYQRLREILKDIISEQIV